MKFIAFCASRNGDMTYPTVITKTEKYGEVIHKEAVSVKAKLVMIVGQHDSGKSRYLQGFYDNYEIYKYQMMRGVVGEARKLNTIYKPVYIKQLDNVSDWFIQIKDWYEETYGLSFKKLTTSEKLNMVCQYLEITRALLLVDDIEMMTGKKVQYVKQMVNSAFRAVVTCRNEVRIHPSLRGTVMERCEQIVRLESQVSYDVTPVILAIMMVLVGFTINPMFGAMLLLGGIGKLATGFGATRNR